MPNNEPSFFVNIAFGSPFEKIDMARVQVSAERAQISKTIKGMILKLVSEVYAFLVGNVNA